LFKFATFVFEILLAICALKSKKDHLKSRNLKEAKVARG